FRVIYAGAHGPANDLTTVLAAARRLKASGESQVHLLLVGDGVEKKGLIAASRRDGLDNVTFLDPVPKGPIPALFWRCHAGLLTLKDIPLYRYGVSPNKLFDYMAAGLPVITNVEGDCAELVRRANCGAVARPGNPESLAHTLAAMSKQPAKDR